MTRNFANRIGHSINHGTGGGVFNTLSQYILNKNNKWLGDGSIDFPSTVSPTTYTPGDGYTYVVMDSSSLFSVFDGAVTIDYMIVAGGGCNGSQPEADAVGGGGAGGFRSGSATVGPGIYICTVGSGSPAGYGQDKPNGSPSSIESNSIGFEITSAGGGRGGSARYPASSSFYEEDVLQVEPTSGGSGGGGGSGPTFYQPMITGSPGNVPAVTPPQGNAGGNGSSPAKGSGGGGGAGGAGGHAGSGSGNGYGGAGGVGRAYPFSYTAIPTDWGTPGPTASEPPTARWFAGGGGGASDFPGTHPAASTVGGAGGGGQGDSYDPGNTPNVIAANGQVNTGGGGGGSRYAISTGGGSGIIIIRYST